MTLRQVVPRRHSWHVRLAALGLAASAALIVLAALLMPGAALADPTADQSVNGCTGAVTGQADPSSILCEPSLVTLGVLPSCPVCPGGLRVVFILREIATESRWMNNEALDALATLRDTHKGPGLEASVIIYGPGRSRLAVPMTDDLDMVRSALGRGSSAANPPDHNNSASTAAREAVKQLKPRDGDDPEVPPCRLALFFAQDSPTPG